MLHYLFPSPDLSSNFDFEITNLHEEKAKFLADPSYNPQLTYRRPPPPEFLDRYGDVKAEHLPRALEILDHVLSLYGSEAAFYEQTGHLLTESQIETITAAYLAEQGIPVPVKIVSSHHFVARTAVKREGNTYLLKIRLPIEHREKNFRSILHHEIGTHICRDINERAQPWHRVRKKLRLTDHAATEEGLATLHGLIDHPAPYLWMPALYYYACSLSQRLTFAQVSQELSHYVPDPERRWKIIVRTKRGITDTRQPSRYTKDQLYFLGTLQISRWLQENHFDAQKLYIGKVSATDAEFLFQHPKLKQPLLPTFVRSPRYQAQIEHILKTNSLF